MRPGADNFRRSSWPAGVEESTLASEVDNVSIQDLLVDVVGVGYRLGVRSKRPQTD